MGRTGVPDLKRDCERALGWYGTASTRAKWRAPRSARISTPKKYLTGTTLSERRCFNSKLHHIWAIDRESSEAYRSFQTSTSYFRRCSVRGGFLSPSTPRRERRYVHPNCRT